MPTSYVDPSSLSLPSPSHSPSPTPSTSQLPSTSTPSSSQPSRKRPRTETSSEDRKEARAHRNRIAAQNSRDRRKAQFHYLERRVQDLEEENRLLRASVGINATPVASTPAAPAVPPPTAAEAQREKENEELRERIRTLERGWDAVVKALAAQGLPTGIPPTPASESSSSPAPKSSTTLALTLPSTSSPKAETPAASPSQAVSPKSQSFKQELSSVPAPIAFPISPAPSHSSLESFDMDYEITSSTLFAPDLAKVCPFARLMLTIEAQCQFRISLWIPRPRSERSSRCRLSKNFPLAT
ncbi:hypothetical protein HGRIS_002760 [Hohenbuehelia grisea]|uniref:X-box-binding protein 1 n=1 Tax=Hohenbuehelia grisea TaxID=104357 RepID=A0ABR3JME1_9AGAR